MTKRVFPRASLATERLVLRPFEAADAADVCAIRNDVEYLRFAPARFPHAGGSLERAAEWCTRTVEQQRIEGAGIAFAAEADGRLVSHVGLFGPNWTAMVCEVHYWTGPWARGHGYAAEATRTVARWGLGEQGFTRIALHANAANAASLAVARAAGFRFEGVLRNASFTRSGRGDMAVYSMIPGDLEGS
jgi:[ribosomal protein S5]-alanine N-acetyltransferase